MARNKVGAGIFILSAWLILAANSLAQEQTPAPLYREGDVWVFNVADKGLTQSTKGLDGNYKVVYKGSKFTVGFPGREKPPTKLDLSELRRMLDEPNEKKQLLQFPLYVGKKWTTAYEAEDASSRVIRRNGETNVTGTEQISTPAGTFRVFKIERYETGIKNKKKGGNERATYTYYYSPEVRAIVKLSYEREGGGGKNIELIKYAPAQ